MPNPVQPRPYFTWEHNVDECLRNGSFVRKGPHGLAQYMNGDFIEIVSAVPFGMTRVDTTQAEKLIPACCL